MELLIVTAAAVIVFLLVEGSKASSAAPGSAPPDNSGAAGSGDPLLALYAADPFELNMTQAQSDQLAMDYGIFPQVLGPVRPSQE